MDSEATRDRCSYFEGLFSPYLEGALDGPERRALADHLRDCESCSVRFGQQWREAAALAVGKGRLPLDRRRALSGTGAWLIVGCLALAAVIVGAVGWLDVQEGEALDPLTLRRRVLETEVQRLVEVQTDMLRAFVKRDQGEVPADLRARAVRFFAAADELRRRGDRIRIPRLFHEAFRATEAAGTSISREAWLQTLASAGLPKVVLVDVLHAEPRVALCRVVWADRPAYAWLVDGHGKPRGLQLAHLLFHSP